MRLCPKHSSRHGHTATVINSLAITNLYYPFKQPLSRIQMLTIEPLVISLHLPFIEDLLTPKLDVRYDKRVPEQVVLGLSLDMLVER